MVAGPHTVRREQAQLYRSHPVAQGVHSRDGIEARFPSDDEVCCRIESAAGVDVLAQQDLIDDGFARLGVAQRHQVINDLTPDLFVLFARLYSALGKPSLLSDEDFRGRSDEECVRLGPVHGFEILEALAPVFAELARDLPEYVLAEIQDLGQRLGYSKASSDVLATWVICSSVSSCENVLVC